MKLVKMLLAFASIGFASAVAFADHDTVARETLKHLQGEWGQRLREGGGGKIFLSAAHAPDDQKTLLSDRAEYLDEVLRARLTPGRTDVFTGTFRSASADAAAFWCGLQVLGPGFGAYVPKGLVFVFR